MKYGLFEEYMAGLFKDVPCYVYEGLLGVFVVSVIVLFSVKSARDGWRWSAGLLLLEYVILIYCSTVVFREPGSEIGHDFTPFWSYFSFLRGEDDTLLTENIMNVVVFMPVGVLVGAVYRSMSWKKVLVIGICLSVGIEVLQFVFRRGFSEVDDVMHNTLGCLIGYSLWRLVFQLAKWQSRVS